MVSGNVEQDASVETRQRLLILTEFLPPDFGAVGRYSLLDAQAAAAAGWEVCLIGLSSGQPSTEAMQIGRGRLTILKVQRRPPERGALFRRTIWTLLANHALLRAAAGELRQADRVVVHSAPPFLFEFVLLWRRRIPGTLVYRLADLHPECAMASSGRPAQLVLEPLRRIAVRLRRRADLIETVGQAMLERLVRDGVEPSQVVLRRDGCAVPVHPGITPMRRPAEVEDRPCILYSGTWGRAHDMDTWVAGYIAHHRQGSGRVVLWLNAVGQRADLVERALRAAQVPVHRTALVDEEQLPSLLCTADAHLITLAEGFAELALPSKFYAVAETGLPILYIGPAQGDIHRLCRGQRGYMQADVNDPAAVAAALERIAGMSSLRVAGVGTNGSAGAGAAPLVDACP